MFVINNQEKCSLLNKTPIQIEMNINPIIPADLITDITTAKAVRNNTKDPDPKSAAQIRIQELTDIRVQISENIAYVQSQQKKYADKRRSAVNELIQPGAKAYLPEDSKTSSSGSHCSSGLRARRTRRMKRRRSPK